MTEKDEAKLIGECVLARQAAQNELRDLTQRACRMKKAMEVAQRVLNSAIDGEFHDEPPEIGDLPALLRQMADAAQTVTSATNDLRRMGIDV